MKNILFIIATVFSTGAFAQDTLYTTKGKIITGQVTEVNQQEIKYKRAANPDGPVYVVDKTDIVLIHYKNGSKDVFENSGSSEEASSNSSNSSNDNTVIIDRRPRVNVVVGNTLPYLAWGTLGWGWGWNRPYYYRGHRWGHGHHHHHHGHFGHRH